jgi:hypothetical protein
MELFLVGGENGFVYKVPYETFAGKNPKDFARKVRYENFKEKSFKGFVRVRVWISKS